MKRFLVFLLFLISSLSLFSDDIHKHEGEKVVKTGSISAVYLTGIGCPNCAATDPVLLRKTLSEYQNCISLNMRYINRKSTIDR